MPTKSTKQLLNFSLFILLGLGILGPYSFSHAEINENPQEIIQEDHDTKNLDEVLENYNQDQQKVLKDAAALIPDEDNNSDLPEVVYNPKPRKESKIPGNLKKVKYSEALKIALEPLQKLSEAELTELLRQNAKGSLGEIYFNRFPKLTAITVRLVRDKDALPNLASILDDQDKLMRFAAFMISTILIAIFLKQFLKREGRSIWKAVILWFFRFMIMSSLRLVLLLYFYGFEIKPIYKIGIKTIFRE